MNLPELVSIREASKALKVHPNTLRNWEKEGLLTSYSINGKRFKRYRAEDILALLQNQTQKKIQVNGQPIELLYYKAIIDNCDDAIIGKTLDGVITSWNPGAERIFGYKTKEIVGKPITILLPEDRKHEFQEINSLINKGESISHYQAVRIRKDKKTIVVDVTISPIKNGKGEVIGASCIVRDITEQKKTENERVGLLAKVDAERTFLETVVEQSPCGVFIAEIPSGKIILANQQAERILRHPIVDNAEFENYEQYQGFHDDGSPYRHEEYPHIRAITKGETVMNEEINHFPRPGVKITISVNAAPIKNNFGEIVAGVVVVTDITEKKRFEENLRFLSESSKKLASSLDYTETLQTIAQLAARSIAEWSAIDILNEKGELEFVSGWHTDPKKYKVGEAFRTKFPVDKNDTVGAGKAFRLGKTIIYSGKSYQDTLKKNVENKERLGYYVHKLGLQASMHVPLCIKDKVIGVISIATSESRKTFTKDAIFFAEALADRAALAIENARLYKEAKEAISTRDEFISMASHELKTPITSLTIHTQLLQRKLQQKNKALYTQVTKMNSQLRHLTRLITDLLDLSRLEAKKFIFHKQLFNIDEVVEDVVTTMQEILQTHPLQMRGAAGIEVFGDPDRIGQVLTNFISNAAKYSPPGRKIIVATKKNAENVIVSVKDFGIGINKEHQTKIFERFYQVSESVDKTFPGLGIGLYLSAEIIRNHNGNIWVDSQKGKGSTFSFSLPIHAQ